MAKRNKARRADMLVVVKAAGGITKSSAGVTCERYAVENESRGNGIIG